jgi:hypothetical protein
MASREFLDRKARPIRTIILIEFAILWGFHVGANAVHRHGLCDDIRGTSATTRSRGGVFRVIVPVYDFQICLVLVSQVGQALEITDDRLESSWVFVQLVPPLARVVP